MDKPKFYYLSGKFLRDPGRKESRQVTQKEMDEAIKALMERVANMDPWKCSVEEIKQLKKEVKGGLK